MKAQSIVTEIGNSTSYGSYFDDGSGTANDQNVLINNNPNAVRNFGTGPNQITGPPAELNFLGGVDNVVDGAGGQANGNLVYGLNHFVQNSSFNVGFGTDQDFAQNSVYSFGAGNTNDIVNCITCAAIGGDIMVQNSSLAVSIGRFHENTDTRSILLGFGNHDNNLVSIGSRSISLGTSNSTGPVFNTLNIRPPSTASNFSAPVTGIGTTSPDAKLSIANKGGSSSSTILNLRDNSSNKVFTVKNNGVVGINRTSVNNTGLGVDLTVQGEAEKGAGTGAWQTFSDKRLKKYTKPFKDGLNTLMEINPVRFKYNGKQNLPTKEEYIGVVAQEIKDIAPYMVNKNDEGYYGYNANALWYILVNAVQEQQKHLKKEQAESDSMKKVLNNQQEQINQLRERLNNLAQQKDGNANRFKKSDNLNEKTVSISAEDNQKQAMLLQNRPNPYSGETVIPYYLPENFDNVSMLITNVNGQVIKRIALENAGKGELTLRTDGLKAGQHLYSLMVDGRKIQTRKMVLKNNR